GPGVTARIALVGGSHYKCEVTRSCGAGASQPRARYQISASGSLVYVGDTSKGIVFTRMQCEPSNVGSSPIDTLGAIVTRSADVVSWAFNDLPRALSFYHKGIVGNGLFSAYIGNGSADTLFVAAVSG